jgi:hypothetical protein
MFAATTPFKFVFLRLGAAGPAVTQLHGSLLSLGLRQIPASELATASFGRETRAAVLEFQRNNLKQIPTGATGTVDQDTAAAILEKLLDAGVDPAHPREYFLAGQVTYSGGSNPAANVTVDVSNRVLRAKTSLASTRTDAQGYYYVCYSAKAALGESGKGAPALVVRIRSGERTLYDPTIDQTIFNAPLLALSTIELTQASPTTPTDDTFTRILGAVAVELPPHLENDQSKSSDVHISEGERATARDSVAHRITLLQENDKVQDISYLSLATTFANQELVDLVVAHRLAASTTQEIKADIPPEFFYGLLATNSLPNFSANNVSSAGTSVVGIDTPIQPLLYHIALLDNATLSTGIKTAANQNVVPGSLPKTLPTTLTNIAKLKVIADKWIIRRPTLEDQIWVLIQQFLESGEETALEKVLSSGSANGDIYGFIYQILTALLTQSPATTASTTAPATLTEASVEQSSAKNKLPKTFEEFAERHSKTPKELASLSRSDLRQLVLAEAPDLEDSQFERLSKDLEAKYPSTAFSAKLKEHVSSTTKSHLGNNLGQSKDFIDAAAVSHFLEKNPDFDLAKHNIDVHFKSADESKGKGLDLKTDDSMSTATKDSLKRIQRVFKLAPTFDKTHALLSEGLHSAAAINQAGKVRVVSMLAKHDAFTTKEAEKLVATASNVSLAASLMVGQFQGISNGLTVAGISAPLPPEKIDAVTKDFPNLATLFSSNDSCACSDCMTLYSPSAYLVDVLEFLKNRILLDSPGGTNSGLNARDAMFKRRPDLADLDLSCDNTNVELPYIDLVCELLEDMVAPSAGNTFIGSVTGPGLISSDLLTFLHDTLTLPFTNSATVSAGDTQGSWVARDKTVVVKLTQLPTTMEWKVAVLRQTYGDAASLAALPAYLNSDAYDRLASSNYLPSLPFDLPHSETLAYFNKFGSSRVELMQALLIDLSPTDYQIALESEGLTFEEGGIITTSQPTNQESFWNSGNASDPAIVLKRVDVFLNTSQIDYPTLQQLLAANGWLNPIATPPAKNMYMKHDDYTCTLAKQNILNLDLPALDRLHRFIRLWKALNKGATPAWTVNALDRAIAAVSVGNKDISSPCIVNISQVNHLALIFTKSVGSAVAVDDVLDLFDVLQLADQNSTSTVPTTYERVFLTPSQGGTVDPVFLPAAVLKNEVTEKKSPGSGEKLQPHADYLRRCLGLSADELQLILNENTNAPVTFASISKVYAVSSLARLFRLSIGDLLIFQAVTKINPLSSLEALSSFVKAVSSVVGAGFTADDLQFILWHTSTNLPLREPSSPALLAMLVSLQSQYATAAQESVSPYVSTATSAENTPSSLSLLSTVPGMAALDVSIFASIFQGTIPATADTFVQQKLGSLGDTTAIINALHALKPAPKDGHLQNNLIKAIDDAIKTHAYYNRRLSALTTILTNTIGATEDVTTCLLNNVPSLSSLLSEDIATQPISETAFADQMQALRLFNVLAFVVSKLGVSMDDLTWILKNAPTLGWLSLPKLPADSSDPSKYIPFATWQTFSDIVALFTTSKYPSVKNVADNSNPFTLRGFFELCIAPNSILDDVLSYLSSLTSWDSSVLKLLAQRFGLTNGPAFTTASVFLRLDTAAHLLRKLNLDVPSAIKVATTNQLSSSDAITMRQALKERYEEPDWLNALAAVQNGLRLLKRDALVAFILAVNKKEISLASDISEYLLIDVEMGTETLTSRIIQAHAAVQMFVQRLRLGLEQTPIAYSDSDDPGWSQWIWMEQYRLWEANRKVFLYPENWIEPTLRDDKSELFQNFESAVQQGELTDDNIQKATAGYLAALDGISDLEVMAAFYQTETYVQHVFARSNSGTVSTFYYRKFLSEQEWTPWEKIVGADVTGNHLVAFMRNTRLTIVWPMFTYEKDPSQAQSSPPVPDPNSLHNTNGTPNSNPPLMQRLNIQLAMSERDPKTGKWSPKQQSRDGVYWPRNNGQYVPASKFPDTIEDDLNLRYWDLGDSAGQIITLSLSASAETLDDMAQSIVGAFSLTGCRGYPEPYRPDPTSRPQPLNLRLYPQILNSGFTTQRYQKSRQLSTTSASPLSIRTVIESSFVDLFEQTFGKFTVTYPSQLAWLDLAILILELWAFTRSATNRKVSYASSSRGALIGLPTGTFMPYFYTDASARSYALIPGFYPPEGSPRTVSDIYKFASSALVLIQKYLAIYYKDPKRDIKNLRALINKDDEYNTLKSEFLTVCFPLTPRGVRQFKPMDTLAVPFYHPLICQLRTRLYQNGMSALLARPTQLLMTSFDFNANFQPTSRVHTPYPVEDLDFSLGGPYSGYNWELFFHLPLQMASQLNQDQQFSDAMKWYQYIFNPQGNDMVDPDTGPTKAAAPQKKYWLTKPFFKTQVSDYSSQLIDSILYNIAQHPDGKSLTDSISFSISQWRSNPYSPYAIARTRPVAFQIVTVLKYIKNLIDWGDNLFTQLTRETITQAAQLYMLADRLLGPKPQIVPPAVKPPVMTYNQLSASKIDLFGNALLDLENLIPDLSGLPDSGTGPSNPINTLYFGIPPNDNMLTYWDLVADRLFKIRHSQNIDGIFISLPLLSPPIDPGALVRALASGASLESLLNGSPTALPHYRFWYMIDKANMLAGQVTYLGSQLLMVLQQRDAEGLARLRSTLEITLLTSIAVVKQDAITEADLTITALGKAKDVATERQTYYGSRSYMNAWEITSTVLSGTSLIAELAVTIGSLLAGGVQMVPTFNAGVAGFGGSPFFTITTGGYPVGSGLETLTGALSSAGRILDKAAGMASVQGSYQRRADDWDFQHTLAGKEIDQISAQTDAAKARRTMLVDDATAHGISLTNAGTVDAYMRNKYTNQELYQWYVDKISTVYFTAYNIAYAVAKQAERCYAHEIADYTSSFIKPSYFDHLKSGLLSGEQLTFDIKQMEAAYIAKNAREYEMTKNVSLEQLDPYALLKLRATGSCTFSIPEAAFDQDCPGQYLRRNKSVSLSIPCVVGPLVGVYAKLTLTSNRYRISTALLSGSNVGDQYREVAGSDTRFVYNIGVSAQSIVTSTGVTDGGVFELQARDERYLPFEGTGAIGSYQIDLPIMQQFDYGAISDVILHISYTAREGGSVLRGVVETAQVDALNQMMLDADHNGLYALYSLQQQFANEWWTLQQTRTVSLTWSERNLPFFATHQGRSAKIGQVTWFARRVSPAGSTSASSPTDPLVITIDSKEVTLNALDGMNGLLAGTVPAKAISLNTSFVLAFESDTDPLSIVDLTALVQYEVTAAATS